MSENLATSSVSSSFDAMVDQTEVLGTTTEVVDDDAACSDANSDYFPEPKSFSDVNEKNFIGTVNKVFINTMR